MKPPIEILKQKLRILKLNFDKSVDDFDNGRITEDKHLDQVIKLNFMITQYKKAIEILERHKYVYESSKN